ncbi:hypothetical protein AQ610_31125 [Burkholderia humptydooensis]|nr:hypothetical protein AQ610_31125 [Burkholderia humptydooensis]
MASGVAGRADCGEPRRESAPAPLGRRHGAPSMRGTPASPALGDAMSPSRSAAAPSSVRACGPPREPLRAVHGGRHQ